MRVGSGEWGVGSVSPKGRQMLIRASSNDAYRTAGWFCVIPNPKLTIFRFLSAIDPLPHP